MYNIIKLLRQEQKFLPYNLHIIIKGVIKMMRQTEEMKIRENIATLYFQRKFNRLVVRKAKNETDRKNAIENGKRIESKIKALKSTHGHYIKMFKRIQGKGSSARYNFTKFGQLTK